MKPFFRLALPLFLLTAIAIPAYAQETQQRVVDEVVAVVNDGVITLSRVKREMKDIVDGEVQNGKKREDAQKMVDAKQGELIANLINEELLVQKAKDLGLNPEVDAAVNQRLSEVMAQYHLKKVEDLYAEMERNGVHPDELKDNWRKQITRDKVLQREVQAKIYYGFTSKDLKAYYEKNKAKFTKPETISFSEIFLGFAGRDDAAVKAKAADLYKQLKAGGDWAKIAKENSDPGVVTNGTGKGENLLVGDMVDVLANPLKGVKVGDYTQPFEVDQLGMVILRVDGREQASQESVFDENAVRMAMLGEKLPDEQKKFMSKLRQDAYIKINDAYRPIVSPLLFADERKEKPGK
jgi:foldase protein PrsA